MAGFHPFQSTRQDLAVLAGGVLIVDPSAQDDGERCNAGVWVNAEEWPASRLDLAVIQEHERLDQLAYIGRADETRDRTVLAAAGAKSDAAWARGHGLLLRSRHSKALIREGGDGHGAVHLPSPEKPDGKEPRLSCSILEAYIFRYDVSPG